MTAIQPSEMSRELKLKLALAALLPDEIEVTDLFLFRWRLGQYSGETIRDTEWDHITTLAARMTGGKAIPWEDDAAAVLKYRGIEWNKP